MKRNLILTFCLILLLALPDITLASRPTQITFVLDGKTTYPGVPTEHGSVLRFTGLEAEGNITGDLVGAFHYIENVTANLATLWGTNQGFMTMTITEGCRGGDGAGTIDIRFEGRTQIDLDSWVAIVADQPFTILKGTEGCEGIHGHGTRNARVSLIVPSFTVTYTAEVHWDPQ